jgi:hypothetical protein
MEKSWKGKFHSKIGNGEAERVRYNSTISLTSALHCGWVVKDNSRPFYPPPSHRGKRPATHFPEDWVSPRDDLDGCRKSYTHWDFFLYYLVLCTSFVLCYLTWFSYISPFGLYLQHTTQISMFPAGFDPATPASNCPQFLAWDRQESISGRPARNESLYRLSYPSPH